MNEAGEIISTCRLLQVLEIDLADLTAEMIAYDTFQNTYPLPARGAYLMLIFQKPGSIHLFTTLRRSTPEKLKWYKGQVGEKFGVFVQRQMEPAQ